MARPDVVWEMASQVFLKGADGRMDTTVVAERRVGWLAEITRYQWLVLFVAWAGWALDAMDFNLYSLVLRPAVTELTAYNTDQVVVAINTGTLIVFPAWLLHSVDANQSELPRISISFNVMFGEFPKTIGQPLWGEP